MAHYVKTITIAFDFPTLKLIFLVCPWIFELTCLLMCVCVCVFLFQVASESEHCIIKREHEKCMEMMALHDPSEDLELGMCEDLSVWTCFA